METKKKKVEVFSAGCGACKEMVAMVRQIACSSCEVNVLDMQDSKVAERAKRLGIHRVPAVVIDGHVADCCTGGAPSEGILRAAGLGTPIS